MLSPLAHALPGVLLVGLIVSPAAAQPQPLRLRAAPPRSAALPPPAAPRPVATVPVGPPLFAEHPALLDAVRRFEGGAPARARTALLGAREAAPTALRPAIDYLVARCDLQLGWLEEADDALALLAPQLPALAHHLALLRAKAALDRGKVSAAEGLAAPLPPGTAGVFDLHLALAQRALDEGRLFSARAFAERAAQSVYWQGDQARLAALRAEVAARIQPDPARDLAAQIALWQAFPRTDAGQAAFRALLAADWPAPLTAEALLDALDRHARRRGRLWRLVVDAGEARFGDALRGLAAYAALARQPSRWARRTLTDAAALLASTPPPAPALVRRVHLLQARAERRLGRVDAALAYYGQAAQAGPSDRLRGRAALEGGHLARKLNRVQGADGLLDLAVAQLDPVQDAEARAAALWARGWTAWRAGDWAAADRHWATLTDAHPMVQDHSRRTYYERALYWRAAAWAELGRVDEARRQWRFVRDRFPFSYYAVLAHHRLPDAGPWAPADPLDAPAPPAAVPAQHADAVWLWQLGLVRDVRNTLRHRLNLGALGRGVTPLLAAAYRARNDWFRSHWVVQYTDPLDVPPVGEDRLRWLAAYPQPYADAVRHQAKRHGVDPLLIWAVMRQESGFRPRVGSSAGAQGLMQLLPATARGMSRRLKERRAPSLAALRQVWPNIHYGAAYLARLHSRYKGHLALTLAAYNAGPGNVDDWLDRFGDLQGDAFVEEIPFNEARGYVRKVLRSYAVYQALYRPAGGPWTLPPPQGHRPGPDAVAER